VRVTEQATTADAVVDSYFQMWNETDGDRRLAAITRAWTPGGSYVDPMHVASGVGELDAMAAGLQQHYPGHRFRLTDPVEAHHDRARWGWEFVAPDGTTVISGVDFAQLDQAGRLREVVGFFAQPGGAA
jgi:hypothetical protein